MVNVSGFAAGVEVLFKPSKWCFLSPSGVLPSSKPVERLGDGRGDWHVGSGVSSASDAEVDSCNVRSI
jgi:hypothetical protein